MERLSLCQTFDRQNISAICLHRKDRAGLDGDIVQHDRARTANAGFTADMGTRQPDRISKKMNQE
jgi:hypothetical protein